MLPVLYSPNEPVYFLGFLPPGSESASVHTDPDPGGISLCGSGSETLLWLPQIGNCESTAFGSKNLPKIFHNIFQQNCCNNPALCLCAMG